MLWTSDLGRTKGRKTRRTARLITIGRLQSGMLIKCFQHLEYICLIVVGFTETSYFSPGVRDQPISYPGELVDLLL